MQSTARPRLCRASAFALFALSAAFLAACAAPQPKAMVNKKSRSKEYFSEAAYGVKASPRVTLKASNLQRGGGREQLGKPYQVRGKWYYPKEDKRYAKVGSASWYGEAFHGRLTANGEVYDMTHLTGAHPTMPLPSYARVTNLKNGSSVIVRVNDRGPFHGGRIIDLSKRAAEMLDYTNVGTAKVKVEYVGRARLDGNDDQYLMASYNPGNRAPDPSDGLPAGVMIAMNGPSPSKALGAAAAPFPGQLTNSASAQSVISADGNVTLPDFGPIAPERPGIGRPAQSPFTVASLSYADERVQGAANVFAALDGAGMSPAEILQSWKRQAPSAGSPTDYIAAGSFEDAAEAKRVAARLSGFGKTEIQRSEFEGKDWYSVNLYPDGHGSLDEMLQAAWSHGAPDALVVRN